MTKKIILFSYLFLGVIAFLHAQTTHRYFDKNFLKVPNEKRAKYVIYPDTNTVQTVYYVGRSERVYAEGRVLPSDTLTFDSQVRFNRQGKLLAVRYFKNGEMIPVIFTDAHFRKCAQRVAEYYVAVGDSGQFHAYTLEFTKPDMTMDRLYAWGHFTDTVTMRLTGRYKEINHLEQLVVNKNFKDGLEVRFIESTMDIPLPYEQLGVVTHSGSLGITYEYAQFIKKCQLAGADGVIGIKSSISTTSNPNLITDNETVLYQGTIIRLKNNP
jgi:hypothetical protein